jgi:general secretion pathway protein C
MHEEGGEMIGFRVEPRNDSPVLSRLGLEPGDILTEVNGRKLGDLTSPTALIQALGESPQANVLIRRNGVDQPMSIDVGQIQRLAESLQ